MSRLIVHSLTVSLDGFGAGPNQSLDFPLGEGAEELHEWLCGIRLFTKMLGNSATPPHLSSKSLLAFLFHGAKRVPRRLEAMLLCCALLAGCYTPQLSPIAPVVVRLAAPAGFTIARTASAEIPASSCRVERAQFEVTALSGDTLYFAKAAVLLQAIEAEPCVQEGAGFVVLADHPELRSERLALNRLMTGASALSVLPALVVVFFLALWSVG